MCIDPVTAMMMIGTGTKIYGSLKDSETEGKRQDENARQTQRQIDQERSRNSVATRVEREKSRKRISRQLAAFAENGIQIEGTARDSIEDNARQMDSEIAEMNKNSRERRESMVFEESRFRAAGKTARKKGRYNAFAKLIDGGTKLAGSF